MHDHDVLVLGHADVELEHVGAGVHGLVERVERVGRELVLAALVGDVEDAHLQPGIVGSRGRRDDREGERERGNEGGHAAIASAWATATRGKSRDAAAEVEQELIFSPVVVFRQVHVVAQFVVAVH